MIPYLSDYLPWRLRQIYETATNGHWELVGRTVGARESSRARFEEDARRVRGGWSDEVPELPDSLGPKVTALALRKGSGIRYRRIVAYVKQYAIRYGLARFSRAKRPSVPAHPALTRKCIHCKSPHTKKQHKFHGVLSFHSSHMRNPGHLLRNPGKWAGVGVNDVAFIYGRVLRIETVMRNGARYEMKPDASMREYGLRKGARFVLPDGAALTCPDRMLLLTPYPNAPFNGEVIRIEAQKTQKHNCDSGCVDVGHRYYHDFKTRVRGIVLPKGTNVLLTSGVEFRLMDRALLLTNRIRGTR